MDQSWWENFKYWADTHKTVVWSGIVGILLLIAIPITVYLVQQTQQTGVDAWVCNNVEVIDNGNQTVNVVVTSGSASWWRIVRNSDQAVMAGPQSGKVFSNLNLPAGAYQVQASDNQNQWTSQNCVFNIDAGQYTAQCTQIMIYSTEWNQLASDAVVIGQSVYLAVSGVSTEPAGLTKARFSFDNGASWQETSQKNPQGEFYVEWTVPDSIEVNVESQVYNPNLGWR